MKSTDPRTFALAGCLALALLAPAACAGIGVPQGVQRGSRIYRSTSARWRFARRCSDRSILILP